MSTPLFPLAVWQSGTNENSIPANDNALRVQVLMGPALSVASTEPASPDEDDQHVIGTSWGGFSTNNVVIYKGGVWLEFEAFEGWFKTIASNLCMYDGAAWVIVTSGGGGSETVTIITEPSAFTATPATHAGKSRYIRAGGNVTFDDGEGYSAGQVFNIRATSAIELVEDGVTLDPTYGGTLELEAGMAVTVVMTSPTNADVIGLTVEAS